METGIGKRQAILDLNVPEQANELCELARGADVFSQGYRLGTLARRKFSVQQVAALRPGIVYVSENCYGHVGPWSERLYQHPVPDSRPPLIGDIAPMGPAACSPGSTQSGVCSRLTRSVCPSGHAGVNSTRREDRNAAFAAAKNLSEGEVREVQRASRHGHVSKREKSRILDQVCEVTGYTRKYALTLLENPPRDEPRVVRKRH